MIKLDQFLKFLGIASTGGQAKWMIVDGEVEVNGILETRRGRKLVDDDLVTIGGQTFQVGEIISKSTDS
ncbi:RNA-binding S4 domain-containing protein [Dolichospermum sp. ST_con]|jgi:ribosome-associated protein|nr:RNA-binding S4 domain-containing protein [Dolichospermum sp. ST_con]MDD1419425.1 RNA-binding S4 domain-containing protein [Dolichospermum sp. ST_sed1]MDD1424062.1 RNA-binding S4 domain-containing protein [Dolichospermum sp. ST_sed9]MDD1429924.1 RNA-binding S4 domain-containing protein [Dolichospermum sp. ST_sed6]MDD1435677.1 RNA-binding S4 domain-containing protein [Dolichospermum sp. ST_sed10]MDD1439352.1 RNA-binding S4 domain-containing protein [Dolichospermum sp. ST_sed3]MDD1446253.1 RN